MAKSDQSQAQPADSIPEDVAHRILARAAEIESREAPSIPLARLREVALEAGIAPAALDQAIDEITTPRRPGIFRRGLYWVVNRLSNASPLPPLTALTINIVAFCSFWVLISLSARLAAALQGGWVVSNGLMIVATLIGLGMAVRVRARFTAVLLAITAAAILAEFPLQLIYGIAVVQGAATKWALMLAGGFGLLLSRVLARRPDPARSLDAPKPEQAEDEGTTPSPLPPDYTTLRLRPASL